MKKYIYLVLKIKKITKSKKKQKKYPEIAEYPFWSMGCLYYYV